MRILRIRIPNTGVKYSPLDAPFGCQHMEKYISKSNFEITEVSYGRNLYFHVRTTEMVPYIYKIFIF
jgi:hypothetical protein